jgi:hypothetical protein
MTFIPPFTPIEVDRERLTIMGVPFRDLEALEDVARGIGSNMYEGFVPTKRDVEIIRDYAYGKISFDQLVKIAKEEANGQ